MATSSTVLSDFIAGGLAIDHVFTSLAAHRVIARCNPDNNRSWALLEGLGFRREGTNGLRRTSRRTPTANPCGTTASSTRCSTRVEVWRSPRRTRRRASHPPLHCLTPPPLLARPALDDRYAVLLSLIHI